MDGFMAPTLQSGNPCFGRFATSRGTGWVAWPRRSVGTINTLRRTGAFAVDQMLAHVLLCLAGAQDADGSIPGFWGGGKAGWGEGVPLASTA